MKTTRFVAMWDMTGLECLINVSAIEKEHEKWEKENVWRILKEQGSTPKPKHIPLEMLKLRARVNSQRHYEIYAFDSTLSEKYIREMFENDPQVIVDSIRNVGHELYSDRVLKKTQVIV
jgi:hypothetical protein